MPSWARDPEAYRINQIDHVHDLQLKAFEMLQLMISVLNCVHVTVLLCKRKKKITFNNIIYRAHSLLRYLWMGVVHICESYAHSIVAD